jgi:hypothetical protein
MEVDSVGCVNSFVIFWVLKRQRQQCLFLQINLLRRLPITAATKRVYSAAALDIIEISENRPFYALELVVPHYFRKSAVVFTILYIYAFEPLPFAESGQSAFRRLHYWSACRPNGI